MTQYLAILCGIFKFKSKAFLCVNAAILSLTLNACGSNRTVDSSSVPTLGSNEGSNEGYNGGTNGGSKIGSAQNISQFYSLSFSEKEQKSNGMAQFRVATSTGDTIRFARESQVTFNSMPMKKIDGDILNTASNILNHFTIIPIFSLFKVGTFYSTGANVNQSGNFSFTDDLGASFSVTLAIPQAKFTNVPTNIQLKELSLETNKSLQVQFSSTDVSKNLEVRCTLVSERMKKYTDQSSSDGSRISTDSGNSTSARETEKEYKTNEISSVVGIFENGSQSSTSKNGSCLFSNEELNEHLESLGKLQLSVEVTESTLTSDSYGRSVRTKSDRVLYREIEVN